MTLGHVFVKLLQQLFRSRWWWFSRWFRSREQYCSRVFTNMLACYRTEQSFIPLPSHHAIVHTAQQCRYLVKHNFTNYFIFRDLWVPIHPSNHSCHPRMQCEYNGQTQLSRIRILFWSQSDAHLPQFPYLLRIAPPRLIDNIPPGLPSTLHQSLLEVRTRGEVDGA